MNTTLKKEIFNTNNNEFLDEYFELFINRLTHSNMSIEQDLREVDSSDNAIRLSDNMRAFKFLLNKLYEQDRLSKDLIKRVANTINDSNLYISNEYRKTGSVIADTNIPISLPSKIEDDLSYLLDCYNNQWKELEPYHKEALFHLYFIRIHPYEDGNGRTSRLLLNFNLLRQGLAPVIITNELSEDYYRCIKTADVNSLTVLFRNQALKENEVIDILYSNYCKEKEKNEDNTHKIK